MTETEIVTIPNSVRKSYIYFHICTLKTWRGVVSKLFQHVKSSGLIDKVERIFVVVLGNELQAVKKLLDHPKVVISYHSMDTRIYERKCLLLLREHAIHENCRFLYIHSKGITKSNYPGVQDWIDLLIYFNIDQHHTCIKELENFDTVGVNLNRAPKWVLRDATVQEPCKSHHYSGNFWWANSEYIRTLPPKVGPKYLDPEFWIGNTTKKKMLSLWQSNVDHYRRRYPPIKYLNKEKRFIHCGVSRGS